MPTRLGSLPALFGFLAILIYAGPASAQVSGSESDRSGRGVVQNLKLIEAEGDNAFQEKRFHDAAVLYSRVLAIAPDRVDLLLARATALSMSDQDPKAINDYKKVLQLEPGNTTAMSKMAAILEFIPGHETEALDLYKRASRVETHVKEKERLAFCVAVLENRLQEESSSAVGCWNMGNRFMVQGKTGLAEKYYSRAIDLDSELFQAYYSRALLRIKMGDFSGALSDLNAAVNLAPSTRGFLTTRGLLHETAGRSARARVDFRRATRIDPRDPEPHYHLGRLYEKDEAYSQALESYTEALRWRPKNELRELIRQRAVAVMPLAKLHTKPARDIIFEDDLW